MDVYKIMPNNSDMTVFKKAGMGGLNFAFGSGIAYYHTAEDTPENLDQRTLQHQGDNAVATARHFGGLDLDKTRHDDVIYASILNWIVFSYRKTWALPLALFTLVLFLAIVFRQKSGARIGVSDLLRRRRRLLRWDARGPSGSGNRVLAGHLLVDAARDPALPSDSLVEI